jgi:hypothetical protein
LLGAGLQTDKHQGRQHEHATEGKHTGIFLGLNNPTILRVNPVPVSLDPMLFCIGLNFQLWAKKNFRAGLKKLIMEKLVLSGFLMFHKVSHPRPVTRPNECFSAIQKSQTVRTV